MNEYTNEEAIAALDENLPGAFLPAGRTLDGVRLSLSFSLSLSLSLFLSSSRSISLSLFLTLAVCLSFCLYIHLSVYTNEEAIAALAGNLPGAFLPAGRTLDGVSLFFPLSLSLSFALTHTHTPPRLGHHQANE